MTLALSSVRVARERWTRHLDSLRWAQGDHLLIAAPTNAGKTTLMRRLVEKRSYVVVCVTKIKDPTFESEFRGWTVLREWPRKGSPAPWENRILLWPRKERTVRDTIKRQREVFAHALDAIYREGNRCIVIDETLMFTDPKIIGLGTEVGMLHYAGRSAGISMVTLSQRPAWVPKVIYSSVTHGYIARTRDTQDLRRLADLGGTDVNLIRREIAALPKRHDYLYVNPQGDAPLSILNTRH